MPIDGLRALTEDVAQLSEKFAKLATAVSESVLEFHVFLTNLPGKVPIELKHQEGFTLSFLRWGESWSLVVNAQSEDAEELIRAPISVKARAMQLFEPMLSEIAKIQANQVALLERALTPVQSKRSNPKWEEEVPF